MARNEHTPEDLETIASELASSVEQLRAMAELMRKNSVPHVLIHATTHRNFHIPAVTEWVEKINLDVKSQVRSYVAGVLSRPEIQKRHSENQKLAAAKKPFTPKPPTKKKSP